MNKQLCTGCNLDLIDITFVNDWMDPVCGAMQDEESGLYCPECDLTFNYEQV